MCGWRDTFAAEGGVTEKAAAVSRRSEAEGDLFVSEEGVQQEDTDEGQKPLRHVTAAQKKRAATRVKSERNNIVCQRPR